MVQASEWDNIVQIIDKSQKIIITTHINPDGDALGSEIAMEQFLLSKGKQVWIINNSPIIYNYEFLDPTHHIATYSAKEHDSLFARADAFLILDISDWERLGDLGKKIKSTNAVTVCIDHHYLEGQFADIDIIYRKASSTGELIFDFLTYMNCNINGEIAKALYTCILTDTGSFRFSNTNARTHEIVSQLLKTGVNGKQIYEHVYEQNSPNKIALMAKALNGLNYECDGQLAWFIITQLMFKETKASHWDTEGFAEIPRGINGVEVSLMFTELDSHKTKISLRSKGKYVINNIAMKYGGGGHNFAAGAVIDKPLSEIIPIIMTDVKTIICEQEKKLC
jgi:bifunctional oligoribonuclease and PAP phosphatase NrnA